MRRRLVVAAVLLVIAGAATASGQSQIPADGRTDVSIEVSTSAMVRSTAAFTAAGQALNRAADGGLDAMIGAHRDRSAGGLLIRLGRLWFVNLPIAALAQGAAHDSGHFARYAEYSDGPTTRRIRRWPWPVPIAVSVERLSGPASPLTEGMHVLGGGEQASTLTKERLKDQIYRHDTTGYFDWALLAYSSLDYPAYAWTDLGGGVRETHGDFRQYVVTMAESSPRPTLSIERRNVERLRRDAWLNLFDFSLWQSFERVGRYLATGERDTANAALRFGRIRLVPATYATLSSLGPERGAEIRFLSSLFLTRVNLRRVTTPADDSLWGAGLALRSRNPRRWLPEATVDIWKDQLDRTGVRIESGTAHELMLAGRSWDASVRCGYKTDGYLLDAPYRATALASVALTARF
jgi:hypothetical protein